MSKGGDRQGSEGKRATTTSGGSRRKGDVHGTTAADRETGVADMSIGQKTALGKKLSWRERIGSPKPSSPRTNLLAYPWAGPAKSFKSYSSSIRGGAWCFSEGNDDVWGPPRSTPADDRPLVEPNPSSFARTCSAPGLGFGSLGGGLKEHKGGRGSLPARRNRPEYDRTKVGARWEGGVFPVAKKEFEEEQRVPVDPRLVGQEMGLSSYSDYGPKIWGRAPQLPSFVYASMKYLPEEAVPKHHTGLKRPKGMKGTYVTSYNDMASCLHLPPNLRASLENVGPEVFRP